MSAFEAMMAALEKVDEFYTHGNFEITPDHPLTKRFLKPEEIDLWIEVRDALELARKEQ